MRSKELDEQLRQATYRAINQSFWKYRKREEAPPPPGWRIFFLGTGGNPEASFTQNPCTAGFVLEADGTRLYIDPGPAAVVRARQMGIDLGGLDGVYISHGHLDHYGGAESVVEGMCWAMFARRGYLLAPRDVLESEHLISYYHQGAAAYANYKGGPQVITLQNRHPVKIKNTVLTPIKAYHGEENYGFVLKAGGLTIGYTSDTNYIRKYAAPDGVKEVKPSGPLMDLVDTVEYREDLKEVFSKVDVLIANVTTHNSWAHRHITVLGLAHLLQGSQVKLCFLTHFNNCCVKPVDLRPAMAEYIKKCTGVNAVSAYDGAVHNLEVLMNAMETAAK